MFQFGYLLLVLLAAFPLGRTFLNQQAGGSPVVFVHRLYRDLAYIAAAVLGIICLEAVLDISLQNYWFEELGQPYRYWLALGLRAGIFAAVFVLVGVFVGYNLRTLCRPLPIVPKSAPWFAAFVFSAAVAFGTTSLWVTLLGYLGATATGTSDPVFGKDISFFLLVLPWYEDMVGIVMTALVVTSALWAAVAFWLYPRSGHPWDHFNVYLAQRGAPSPQVTGALDVVDWGRWTRQGLALGALLCLTSGISRFLGRYYLIVDGHSQVVAGGSFADVNFWIPAYGVVDGRLVRRRPDPAGGSRRSRAFATGCWRGRRTGWSPAGCSSPSTSARRSFRPPSSTSMSARTRSRSSSLISSEASPARGTPTISTAHRCRNGNSPSRPPRSPARTSTSSGATLQDARIWDWRALEPQLQQIQGLRPYYTFAGVDIDRYMIDGAERQVMITARELNVDKLPDQAKVWVNLALKYTHGYGAVAVPTNEIDSRGNPLFWAHDIPIKAKGDLAVEQGEIYYGVLTRDRVYVRTTEKEFDFPQGDANSETVYEGKGGIALSNFWRKLVVAHEIDGLRLFISDYFTAESRVLIWRNVVERVEQLAPFLTFDRDPYIVADGDHYVLHHRWLYQFGQLSLQRGLSGLAVDGCAAATTCATRSRRWSTPITAR